ncbi:MAG: PAS domain S-box protein [Smithellaceae bacterium]|jgi:PAS domain S-box-containing protein
MKLHLLTLKFSGNSSKLEAPFLSDYYRVSLPHIRISLVLGALLYASFGILDALLMPEQKSTIWFIRFVIVCPVLFGTFLASFSKSFERYMQPLLAGVYILAGGGIICMIVIAPPPVNYSYYAGLLLVFMWGYTFIRILFIWASLAGWVLVALYEIAAIWISPTPFAVLLNNNFFFISANVIGMLACYSIEFYARRDFFLTQQLEIEREKINKVNQELEERVEKRIADYQIINRALEQEITGHEQAEEALRQSESKYRFMTDNVADIIWTVDMNLNFTYISPSVQRFRGFTVEEVMSQKMHEVLTPESLQYALQVMEEENKVLMGNPDRIRDKLTIELEEYCKDGSTIWTENELKYLPDQDGKPIGIIGVTRDISARKQAEEALRESEKYFKEITENSSDMIIITDNNGDIKYCSRSVERFTGYKPEELIGRSGFTFIHPDDIERAVGDFGKAILTIDSAIPNAFRMVHKDGSEHYCDGLGKNLLDNPAVAGFIMNIRDITERKRAEEALQESEDKYRLLAESISDVIWVLDLNMLRFTYCNPSIKQMLGYTQEEYLLKSVEEIVAPSSYKSATEAIAEELEIDKKEPKDLSRSRVIELELVRKDGSTVWAEVRAKFVRDSNGQTIEILGVSRDISDSKRAEEQRQRMEERLRRAEKMEALGTLAGGVAHDLNNILSGIVGYPDLILMNLPEESPLRDAIVTIRQSGQRAAAVVQDLLTLARRGVVYTKVLNLNDVISEYMKTPEQEEIQVYQPNVRFEIRLAQGLLPVKGSRVQLSKTIMNLLLNAAEAMPAGGGVTITTMVQYLDRPVKGYEEVQEGYYAVLMVSDTGKGIPAEDRGRIFEPFYTKKVMGRTGTGLGLAVVWGTVKDHNGYIDVQSEEGKGSTFTLYFPVTREEMFVEAASVSISEYMGKGETILVVDDVREQRDLAEEMLKKLNYKVSSVSSGEEAIAYIKEHKVDLLILDMIMDPGIDGLDTYRSVLEIQPKQKAIIVSGFSESNRVHAAHALGVGEYVKKPYVIEKLGMAVRKELDRSA